MKTMFAMLFAFLIGLTVASATFANAGKTTGASAATQVAGGKMKKGEGQQVAKTVKKHYGKKHGEGKKEEKK